jgi:hypothetical protein
MITRATCTPAASGAPAVLADLGVLFLNVSAGIGILGMASPLLQEVFGGR